jgi:Ni/Co efflux regulator RcnB
MFLPSTNSNEERSTEMKKLVAAVAALALMLGSMASAQAASLASESDALRPKKITGKITSETKVSDSRTDIEAKADKNGDEEQQTVILHITPSTYVADSTTGVAALSTRKRVYLNVVV